MKNIVLTGFMASGKTVTGKEIARITGYKFIDMDCMIEAAEGKTVNEIFADCGEKYFRTLESQAAQRCSEFENTVISCGGGTVLRPENIQFLRKNGIIFNLNPTEEVIRQRLSAASATRPLLKNDNADGVIKRFEARKPFYNDCDYKIEILPGKSVESVAEEIIKFYNLAGMSSTS